MNTDINEVQNINECKDNLYIMDYHENKINECKLNIKCLEVKISNLTSTDVSNKLGVEFCKTQIIKNKNLIMEWTNTMNQWIEKKKICEDVHSSYYNECKKTLREYSDNIRKNKIRTNHIENPKPVVHDGTNYKERKKIKKMEKSKRKSTQLFFETNGDRDFALESYWRTTETFPDMLYKQLLHLPNNYGYIWKRTWFLGRLERDSLSVHYMFEKIKDGFFIHEFKKQSNQTYKYSKYKKKDINYLIKKYIHLKQ